MEERGGGEGEREGEKEGDRYEELMVTMMSAKQNMTTQTQHKY